MTIEPAATLQRSEARETPLAYALGFHRLYTSEDKDIFGADSVSALSERDGNGLCGGAMLAFADHGLGARIVRANQGASTSTVDLRMEWFAMPTSTDGIRLHVSSLPPRNGITFATAQLVNGDGVFARASGAFASGVLPGGDTAERDARPDNWQRTERPDFRSFTGARWQGEQFSLPPLDHLIGAIELPAFHGGAVAAALHMAASDKAAHWHPDRVAVSMTMRFLRPAVALGSVDIDCQDERAGKRMATYRCHAAQNGRVVAVGEFVFWR